MKRKGMWLYGTAGERFVHFVPAFLPASGWPSHAANASEELEK